MHHFYIFGQTTYDKRFRRRAYKILLYEMYANDKRKLLHLYVSNIYRIRQD